MEDIEIHEEESEFIPRFLDKEESEDKYAEGGVINFSSHSNSVEGGEIEINKDL